jgi:two-component sensor histidine kinase/HAMP domain-containing protein
MTHRPPTGSGRRGLRFHLVVLVLIVLVPALGLGMLAAAALAESYRRAFEAQLQVLARSAAASLDETLDAHLALGRALAASGSLQAGDIDAFDAEARAAGEAFGTWVSLIGPGPDYRRYVNTALPIGQRPAYGGLVLPAGQAPIPAVFATGRQIVTNVGLSIAFGRPTALVLTPVTRDGVVAQVVGLGFEPGRVAGLLQAHRLSDRLVATVVDGRQRILAASQRHGEVAGRPVPDWQGDVSGTAEGGLARGPSAEGVDTIAAIAPLARANWRVVVSAPASEVTAAIRGPLLIMGGGGLLLLTLAAALALWLARRVTRPIARLAEATRPVSADGWTGLRNVPPAPIAEVEVLREALLRAEAATAERREREQADAARQMLLTAELSHRVKNALAVVQAALRLTPRHDATAYAAAVEGRVAALARANAMLAETEWQGADLAQLLAAEIAPFRNADGGGPAVEIAGPEVLLVRNAVQPFAIAVHELATNAVKYGALSIPEGRLVIGWSIGATGGLQLSWSEAGRPVAPPGRSGFGSRILDATLRGQLGGSLEREWGRDGLRCTLTLPHSAVLAAATSQPVAARQEAAAAPCLQPQLRRA